MEPISNSIKSNKEGIKQEIGAAQKANAPSNAHSMPKTAVKKQPIPVVR